MIENDRAPKDSKDITQIFGDKCFEGYISKMYFCVRFKSRMLK